MIVILPLLMILIIIGGTYFIAIRLKNNGSVKRIHWMFGSYLIILVVSTIVYFLLPRPEVVADNNIKENDIINIVDRVYEEKSFDDASAYIQEQWEFEYEGNELKLEEVYHDERYLNVLISVERKEVDDGKIEATFYQTPVIIEGLNITKYLEPIDVKLSSSTMQLIPSKEIKLFLNVNKSEFPIRQFSGERWWANEESNLRYNEHILRLQVPKSVEVIDVNESLNIWE